MRQLRSILLAAACGAALTGGALAQTTGTAPAGTTATPTTVPAPTDGAAASYVRRIEPRFARFAGSSANLDSLAGGLRGGTEITLMGSGETATFTPPTRPMGYGNVTRALDLAQRQLAAAGITEPTPQEIQAALTGGTVSGSNGDLQLPGVLQLRSEGMGWGQIAHSVGVHPGMGKSSAAAAPGAGGTTSAGGAAAARNGVVTASGGKPAAVSAPANRAANPGISTANGRSGIVTAAGGNALGRGALVRAAASASATTTAAGASAGGGMSAARGQGNAFGHANK